MLAVVHAGDAEGARGLIEQLKQAFNIQEIILTELAIPVVANLGPGTIGIVAIPVDQGDLSK